MNFLPGFLIIVLFSVIIGVLFHLWKGGSVFRLILLLLFAIFGFFIGHLIGVKLNLNFFVIGWVQAGSGLVFSILLTWIASWLSNLRIDK
jgi:hypothetical protein